MSLDPFELCPTATPPSNFHQVENGFNKVPILDFLPGRCNPILLDPVRRPDLDALDGVVAVGADLDVLLFINRLEGSYYGCQLGAVVGLDGSHKRL